MGAAVAQDVYVTPLSVDDMFADETYQRPLDQKRAKSMATAWDRRLAGIIEVSDRGEDATPRYAIIDGGHRCAAARLVDPPPLLVANVHEGLTRVDEAVLFDKLNRERRRPGAWDHWRARKAAGDPIVASIEKIVACHGLRVHEQSDKEGIVTCISTLEKIAAVSIVGPDLLDASLRIAGAAWGTRRDAYDAPILHAIAILVFTFAERIDGQRFIDAVAHVPPRRIRLAAHAMRDHTHGSLPKLTALVLIEHYNRMPGKKLITPRGWGGGLPRGKPVAP